MRRLMRVEALKLFRDKAMRWAVLGLPASTALTAIMFLFGREDFVKRGIWTASSFLSQTTTFFAFILGPMMLAVIGAQLVTIEYRQKTLKGLLPLPASLPGIFAAKAVMGCLVMGIGILLTAGLALCESTVLGLPPAWPLMTEFLRDFAVLWVSFLPLLLFAALAGLAGKNFVIPLAASAFALVGGMLALQGGKGQYFWTAIPMMLLGGGDKLADLGPRLLTSMAYTLVFLLMGLSWAKLTRRPE